jgi:hypothetical protein
VVIVPCCQFVGARDAFLEGLVTVPLEHQGRGAARCRLYHTPRLSLGRA